MKKNKTGAGPRRVKAAPKTSDDAPIQTQDDTLGGETPARKRRRRPRRKTGGGGEGGGGTGNSSPD